MAKEDFSFRKVKRVCFDPDTVFKVLYNIHSRPAKEDLKREIDCGMGVPRIVVRVEKKTTSKSLL